MTEPDTMQDGWDAALARIRALNLAIPAIQVPAVIEAADALADAIELWRGEQRKSVQDALNAYYAARRHPGETAQGEVGQR